MPEEAPVTRAILFSVVMMFLQQGWGSKMCRHRQHAYRGAEPRYAHKLISYGGYHISWQKKILVPFAVSIVGGGQVFKRSLTQVIRQLPLIYCPRQQQGPHHRSQGDERALVGARLPPVR